MADVGVKYCSLYAFSTENFKREISEVEFLMNLFITSFEKEFQFLIDKKVRVLFSGRREPLPEKVLNAMDKLVALMNKIGIGKGSFSGPISKTVINTIIDSVKSPRYHMIKSNISDSLTTYKRMNYVLKELKKKTNSFANKEEREKYKDAVYALKRALKITINLVIHPMLLFFCPISHLGNHMKHK